MYNEFLQTLLGLANMLPEVFLKNFLEYESETFIINIIKHDQSDRISSEDLKEIQKQVGVMTTSAFETSFELFQLKAKHEISIFETLLRILFECCGTFKRTKKQILDDEQRQPAAGEKA